MIRPLRVANGSLLVRRGVFLAAWALVVWLWLARLLPPSVLMAALGTGGAVVVIVLWAVSRERPNGITVVT